MDETIYDDMPKDEQLAFAYLESYFGQELDNAVAENDDGRVITHYRANYIKQVIAAAAALNINALKSYELPNNKRN